MSLLIIVFLLGLEGEETAMDYSKAQRYNDYDFGLNYSSHVI